MAARFSGVFFPTVTLVHGLVTNVQMQLHATYRYINMFAHSSTKDNFIVMEALKSDPEAAPKLQPAGP